MIYNRVETIPRIWLLTAGVFFLFFGILNIKAYPYPYERLDEQAHLSYAYHIVQYGWPDDMNQLKFYDTAKKHWTTEPNYINHPPFSYYILSLPIRFGLEKAVILRFYSHLFYLSGYLCVLAIPYLLNMSRKAFLFFAVSPILLGVPNYSAIFSNDSIAFLGGSIMCLGCVLIAHYPDKHYKMLAFTLLGLLLTASSKINAILLVGLFFGVNLFCNRWLINILLHNLKKLVVFGLLTGLLISLTEYLLLWEKYGSPVPETKGQLKMLLDYCVLKPMLPLHIYLKESVIQLISGINGGIEKIIYSSFIVAGIVSYIGLILQVFLKKKSSDAFVIRISFAAFIATILTLVIHLTFSYQRHLLYYWQPELYSRYYFPLLAVYLFIICSFFSTSSIKLRRKSMANYFLIPKNNSNLK